MRAASSKPTVRSTADHSKPVSSPTVAKDGTRTPPSGTVIPNATSRNGVPQATKSERDQMERPGTSAPGQQGTALGRLGAGAKAARGQVASACERVQNRSRALWDAGVERLTPNTAAALFAIPTLVALPVIDVAMNAPAEVQSEPAPQQEQQVVTLEQLQAIMPNLPPEQAEAYLPHLNEAMRDYEINTPKRAAAFLAQLAHESAEFRYFEEIGCYQKHYAPYCGRGAIQLTWEENYRAASLDLFGDTRLVDEPTSVLELDTVFAVSGWFWDSRNLNALADEDLFIDVSVKINGGTNGLDDRLRYWETAKAVYGISENA